MRSVIELAKEAGAEPNYILLKCEALERFAALVRAEALEEAAKWFEGNEDDVGYAIATEIRGLK